MMLALVCLVLTLGVAAGVWVWPREVVPWAEGGED